MTLVCLIALSSYGCVDSGTVNNNTGLLKNNIDSEDINDTINENIEKTNSKEIIEPMTINDYFSNNSIPVDFESDDYPTELMFLESDLENKVIFLTGEVHNVEANHILRMNFLKYFKEKTDFKYYLCEMPYSSSYFMNQYLESGDETLLKQIYNTSDWTQENYSHWTELYEYNSRLNEDQKIHVVGIDIEHDYINSYRFLEVILPRKEVPEEIKESITLLKETYELLKSSFQNKYKAPKNAKLLLADIEENRTVYMDYLEDDFIYFELVIQNVLNGQEAYKHHHDTAEWNNTRDLMIYENFVKIDALLPPNKYFGQWGVAHIFQHKDKDIMWFASYLNSDESKYKDKVLSIAYNYLNCEMMASGSATPVKFVFPFVVVSQDLYADDYILYKLNNSDTNRPKIPMFHVFTGEILEEDIAEFVQYLVLIKNSDASQPLK
jgi:hypothetical protein